MRGGPLQPEHGDASSPTTSHNVARTSLVAMETNTTLCMCGMHVHACA